MQRAIAHVVALGDVGDGLHEMRLEHFLEAVSAAVQRGFPESPVHAGVFPGENAGGR